MSRAYESWSSRGADAVHSGAFSEAEICYGKAREIAVRDGDPARVDQADLNLAMVRLQRSDPRRAEAGLRRILLRARDDRTAFAAAYNLASSLRLQGRFDRALLYARRALEKGESVGSPDLLGPVHNLIGNILLGQSYLDEALGAYEASLRIREAQSGDTRYSRAILQENIGYCLLLKREVEAGLGRIRTALALAEDTGDQRCRAECYQDLCYGLLLDGDHEAALRAGETALHEAVSRGYADIEENCHYLMGELGARTDDRERRDRHFGRLQELHPDVPFLSDFLCSVDVTDIITLKR